MELAIGLEVLGVVIKSLDLVVVKLDNLLVLGNALGGDRLGKNSAATGDCEELLVSFLNCTRYSWFKTGDAAEIR